MAREITPNGIRETALKRRPLGYDRHETEQLLAEVAESLERILWDRSALSQQAAELQRDLERAKRDFKGELERLNAELAALGRRLPELEGELAILQKNRSKQLEEADRLTEELSGAKAAEEEHRAEMTELGETVARLETREKALAEQIAMLESQLEHAHEEEATTAAPQALAQLDDHAATTLLRLDRAVETVEREAREEAERVLERAQKQAEEILRSAEAGRQHMEAETAPPTTSNQRHDEYDPVAALGRVERPGTEAPATYGSEQAAGEAAWTSGRNPHQLPEQYS
jgi:cell division septum initiation protein DivIVA